jgi:riboflavin kinase/FMN adenylyltransferase
MKILHSLEELPHGFSCPVATIGNFDGMHLGHQQLMRNIVKRARKIGGTPTVVTFNPHPLQILAPNNAPRMIQTLRQRLMTIESLGIEFGMVIPFTAELAQTGARDFAVRILWEKLQLKEIYVGPNFAFGHRREGSFDLLKEIGEERGFFVGKIPQVQFRGARVSSTAVRQSLFSGQVARARRLLGRPFALEGNIAHGAAMGAGIGFPTANLETPNELIPRKGVYVTLLGVGGRRYKAVTNVGVRPTLTAGAPAPPLSIETHVLDIDLDLYGTEVTLEFLVRLREERRFPGKDALVAQIQKDIQRARRYFQRVERAAPGLIAETPAPLRA